MTPEAALHFDLKTFVLGVFPSEWIAPPTLPPELVPFLPPGVSAEALLAASGLAADPSGQGVTAGRLRAQVRQGQWVLLAHHELSLSSAAGGSALGTSSGVGLSAPELVDLTWEADTGDALRVRGRTDRLSVAWAPDGAQVTVGRQPVSFGTGLVFAPMDVVNPFSAATIDTEYKPGVDAVRFDAFFGTSGKATVVGAWAGPRPPFGDRASPVDGSDLVFAGCAQGTIGVTDVIGLAARVRGDLVGGLGVVSSVGPIGVHGDLTVTRPSEQAAEDDPFVRAVVGADGRPTGKTTVSGELYVQTLGASSPDGYLDFASGPRFSRGELWTMGRTYGAVSVAQEVTPLVAASAALIGNLADPSALLAPGLSVSAADDVTVAVGGFVSLGRRPDAVPLGFDPSTFAVLPPDPVALAASVNSEFGLYPPTVYVSTKAWF